MAEATDKRTKLLNVIAERSCQPLADVTPEKTWSDLGMDSLDTLEMIMEIEKAFDIKISDTEMEKIASVQDAINYIESRE